MLYKQHNRRLLHSLGISILALCFNNTSAQEARLDSEYNRHTLSEERQKALPKTQQSTRLNEKNSVSALLSNRQPALHRSLQNLQTGRQQVLVQFKSGATANTLANGEITPSSNRKFTIESQQNNFISRHASGNSVKVLGQLQHVLNATLLDVPAQMLPAIAEDSEVLKVLPVGHYELFLSETVSYVGAKYLQKRGLNGKGIKIGVLDSGIDYHHADLGGSGLLEDYETNDPTLIEAESFPTAKVAGGYDFVGSNWPLDSDVPEPDPDPLDDGIASGHGTHVADIIAGNEGVAPGAELYAIKVCSSVGSACNGISILLGLEFAADPNFDGDTSDHLDVINLSLGAGYGQPFDDAATLAIDNLSALGVLTVASAGNCGDKPYCTGTPAAAPSAVSVAQTNVPSAQRFFMRVTEPASAADDYPASHYPWTPLPSNAISGPVQYGDLDGTNLDGCAPFASELSGMIVAVDRGACAFSDKVRNIEQAGGVLGIVMLIAPGAPFAGAFGGGDAIGIPGFNISQAAGDILRAGSGAVTFSPELVEPLVGVTVSSTARGPDMSFNAIKPDIGAPGASVSAVAGSGTNRSTFGGTSGAAPMVSGAAAQLLQDCKRYKKHDRHKGKKHRKPKNNCQPYKIKAQLMNYANTMVFSDTTGELAEITRIGGGELQVDAAVEGSFVAYETKSKQASISLGFMDIASVTKIKRSITLKNLSKRAKRIKVSPQFRFANKEASGAIDISVANKRLWLPPKGSVKLKLAFTINPELLPSNAMSSGGESMEPATLSTNEFSGYIVLSDKRGDEVSLPWHILPRKAAKVSSSAEYLDPDAGMIQELELSNQGAGVAQTAAYSVLGLSDELPRGEAGLEQPVPDLKSVGVASFAVDPSLCQSGLLWEFAVTTWDRQSNLLPVSHEIRFDTNRDGFVDYSLRNLPVSLLLAGDLSDARQVSWVINELTGAANGLFFAEHATNTANTVLRMCGEQIGLTQADMETTPIDITVNSSDVYFGGPGDQIDNITLTPLAERYSVILPDLAPDESSLATVVDSDIAPEDSPQNGIMVITNSSRGAGEHGGATATTESLLFLNPETSQPTPLP